MSCGTVKTTSNVLRHGAARDNLRVGRGEQRVEQRAERVSRLEQIEGASRGGAHALVVVAL